MGIYTCIPKYNMLTYEQNPASWTQPSDPCASFSSTKAADGAFHPGPCAAPSINSGTDMAPAPFSSAVPLLEDVGAPHEGRAHGVSILHATLLLPSEPDAVGDQWRRKEGGAWERSAPNKVLR